MTHYPWLENIYKKIISYYKKKKLHHAILFESYNIQNTFYTIFAIIRWILCNKKNGFNFCNKCQGCYLTKNRKHPNLYIIYLNQKNKNLEIEYIRNILHSIQNTQQQKGKKILWIPQYSKLTESGINILLKIIEEPPKNTFFFIGNDIQTTVYPILKSRCLSYLFSTPNENKILNWLINYTKSSKELSLIELRINNYDPFLTKQALQKKYWMNRKNLYKKIFYALNNNNFLILLSFLTEDNILIKIHWIILLLLDAMKFQKKCFLFLININYMELINQLSKKYSYDELYLILKSWIVCKYQLRNIKNLHIEFLIVKNLLKWDIINHKI
ncbi:DNA polymerase III subunit delta' C-terminal domain-containing protein [Buchnera aphidicola]|uniref:DNA polymerase III subunit delta' C-terminal domain-containing protein n=1 Tax=Buchnera aphidicola TaxID=9 RepID=UPI003463C5BF